MTVRTVMYAKMACTRYSKVPAPLEDPDEYWLVEPNGKHILRPKWESWPPNESAWVMELVVDIRAHGAQFSGAMPSNLLEKYSDTKVKNSVQRFWDSLKKKHKAENPDDARIKNRDNARKGAVSVYILFD